MSARHGPIALDHPRKMRPASLGRATLGRWLIRSDPLPAADQLAALHEQGGLTDDEFAAAKARLLGG